MHQINLHYLYHEELGKAGGVLKSNWALQSVRFFQLLLLAWVLQWHWREINKKLAVFQFLLLAFVGAELR